MNTRLFLLIILLGTALSLFSIDDLAKADQQALAFFAAKDYAKATDIYERLLKQDLPDWQYTILLYNLGTIELVQSQFKQALDTYRSIPLQSIASPRLLRYLRTNEAHLYLRQAETAFRHTDERIFLLYRSLKKLELAKRIDCQIQKYENKSINCIPSKDLDTLFQLINWQLNQAHQQERDEILKGDDTHQVLVLLTETLQKFLSILIHIQSAHLSTSLKPSYLRFSIDSGYSLLPLWQHLHNQSFNKTDQSWIENAEDYFTKALQALEQQDLEEAISFIEASIKDLNQIHTSYSNSPEKELQQLLFHYQILLTKENLLINNLQNLIQEQQQLSSDFSKQDLFEQSSQNLAISLKQLQAGQEDLTRFFLTYSFYLIQDSSFSQDTIQDPKKVLQRIIQLAKRAFQLNRLSESIAPTDSSYKNVKLILQDVQSQTVQLANQFPERVIQEEIKHFQQAKSSVQSRCQKKPWNQAIPLFEKGYQKANVAKENLAQEQSKTALINQGESILDWEQVLQLMEEQESEPEENQETNQSEAQVDKTSAQINEVFHLLQEMQTEDAPTSEDAPKELHSW